jgi:adenosylmethionine-8-amino-7-oxononanoate aminotransferase
LRPDNPAVRAYETLVNRVEKGVRIHIATAALAPPLIVELSQIEQICDVFGETLDEVA